MKRLLSTLLALASIASASTTYVLLGAGQSLILGDTGCPAISTTQVGGNQTYSGGLISLTETLPCDNTGLYNSGTTYQSWAALENGSTFYEVPQGAATTSLAPPNSPWVVVTTKETPLSSALNHFYEFTGVTGSVGNNFGQGGTPISTWGSSSKISSMQTTLQSIKTAVSPNNVVVMGVFVQGGESDFDGSAAAGSAGPCSYTGGNTGGNTTYYSNSICFQQAVQSMAQGVTGQTQPVPVIYSQMNGISAYKSYNQTCPDGTANGCIDSYPVLSTASHVPVAQYQLARDSANTAVCGQAGYPACGAFYLVGPKYHLDTGTNQGPHLSAVGYNLLGAESAAVLSCLYSANFSTNNSCGGVMPQTPIYVSGTTVTLNVQTPGGLSLDSPSNAVNNTWSNGAIPVPYYGNASSGCPSSSYCQHNGTGGSNNNYGFQFFTSNGEILVTNVTVSGTTITLTLASTPTGNNWQLAYAFEGTGQGAPNGSWGCAWNSGSTCDFPSSGDSYDSGGSVHGNIRTVVDSSYNFGQGIGNDLHGDPVYHWMPHFIENVVTAPPGAVLSGGLISGGVIR